MRRVLMICYYYPPLGGIGSQRSQKLARYLPEYGWLPTVLTPEHGSYFVDPSLDDGTAHKVNLVRTGYLDLSSIFKRAASSGKPSNGAAHAEPINLIPAEGGAMVGFLKRTVRNWVYIPDGQIGWYPYAVQAGERLIETRGFDAIYSTSFPITAHLAARKLKQLTGKPWIADFRDMWTENHYADYSSAFRKRLDQIIESNLLEAADRLVTVSNAWADTLRKLSGGRKSVEVIRNGFDETEFAEIEQSKPTRWTLTYVGNFYGYKQDPSPVLQSLKRLIESGRISRDDFEFKIVGAPDPYVQNLLESFNLADVARFTGFVSHQESLAHQVNSSLLLIILHADRTNSGHVPGKLYEYLGSRTPVLAMIPPDFEAAEIIRETCAGTIVPPGDTDALEKCLMDSYSAFKSGESQTSNAADLSSYGRKAGAHQLAALLSDMAG